jgi:hypothetical protein
MANKPAVNAFQSGMVQDIDILKQPNQSYRDSMGGRLMFNDNGTYSWEVENGNKVSFTMAPRGGADANRYLPLGHTGNSNIRVMLTVDPINGSGEIGIFSIDSDGIGTYKTLFNDQDDPNGDSLNFNPNNQIEARFLYENDQCIRVYWVDGIEDNSNQPRVFTFSYDRSAGNPSNVVAYSAATLSVHAINSQAEFLLGIIKYDQSIAGSALSGVYQFTYRLGTNDGYRTPWSPLGRKIFLTTDGVSNVNWNTYEMEGSGLNSGKGNRIEVKGIDQRFDEIEVAYVYSETPDVVDESTIFAKSVISGTTMSFDHVSNDGEPLITQEIPAIFSGIKAAKTLNIKDTTLYYGNVVEGLLNISSPEDIVSGVTVSPVFRDMRSDELVNAIPTILTPPITHANTTTANTIKKLHSAAGGTESYNIVTDYVNYKGTQVEHLYTGYFRGETYRFAVVFYDLLGFPAFAIHLCDVKFPDQSSDTFTAQRVTASDTVVNVAAGGGVLPEKAWPTNNYGDYTSNPVENGEDTGLGTYSHIRIMGLEVNGIDTTSIASQISGFKIVRVALDATILAQGLLYPCVRQNDISRPFPFPTQQWFDGEVGGDITGATAAIDVLLDHADMLNDTQPKTTGTTPKYSVRPNFTAFYTPDYDFDDSRLPVVQTQDKLRLIGGCFTDGRLDVQDLIPWNYIVGDSNTRNKFYYSKNDFHVAPADPYPTYLDEADIAESIVMTIGNTLPDYIPGLDLHNTVEFEEGAAMGYTQPGEYKGWGKGKTIFYRTGNFGSGTNKVAPYFKSNVGGVSPYQGTWICNYTRPNANPYGGLSLASLETDIFHGTGHFQPVNNPTFATPISNVYDEIEVWGGDCYLDYFGFARTYGRFETTPGNDPLDYSLGVIFPWESTLNHSLRQAASQQNPMFSDVGNRNHDEYVNPGTNPFSNGLYFVATDDQLIEEFNLNEVLLFQELTQFYTPEPFNFKDNLRFPVRWRYTREKFYGDPVDTWRTFQVNDFKDLNGEYGEITSSLYMFNQIYSWQISAFGRLRASDRALIKSQGAGTLTTGIGDKLDGIDYISTVQGNQHQWSLFTSGNAAYWVDVNMRSIMRFAQDGRKEIDEAHALHNFSENTLKIFEDIDNPAFNGGITGAFDHGNKDAIWSLIYNEYIRINANLVINSERIDANDYFDNNSTVFIDWFGVNAAGTGVLFPEGITTLGENNNAVHYVCSLPTGSPFYVNTVSPTGTITGLISVNPGQCVELKRDKNTLAWTATPVLKSVITPEPFSFSFNENLNAFQGFHAYRSTFLVSHKHDIISHDFLSSGIDNKYYAHDYPALKNNFYGLDYKALLSVVIADIPMVHKIFDDLRINCNDEASNTISRILMATETQSYYLDMTTDTRKKYLEDILRVPLRTKTQDDRTRGKHVQLTFEFLNNSFKPSRMTNLVTFYRTSNRV